MFLLKQSIIKFWNWKGIQQLSALTLSLGEAWVQRNVQVWALKCLHIFMQHFLSFVTICFCQGLCLQHYLLHCPITVIWNVCVCVCTFSLSPRAWYGKSAQGGLSSAPQALTDTAFRSSAGALLFESGISSAWSHQKPCGGGLTSYSPISLQGEGGWFPQLHGNLAWKKDEGQWPAHGLRAKQVEKERRETSAYRCHISAAPWFWALKTGLKRMAHMQVNIIRKQFYLSVWVACSPLLSKEVRTSDSCQHGLSF